MLQKDIRDLSFAELQHFLVASGQPVFRAQQICEWLYKKDVAEFAAMTNLPPALRAQLAEHFRLQLPEILDRRVASDGTQKFLLGLSDQNKVETVLIPATRRTTVCLSSQAGCKFACRFCASGIGGWARNLSCAEILGQLIYARRFSEGRDISHVVFMGTGEPLDNYEAVLSAVRTINAKEGFGIGARRITISTCGVVPQIKRLAEEGLQIELSISLHGYNDQVRSRLMPVNRKYPLATLMEACRGYCRRTKRQITFEYILIKDLTCVPEAATALRQLFNGIVCKMNLIPYNQVPEYPFQSPSPWEVKAFQERLEKAGIHATVRASRGEDAAAACGQLRHNS